MAINNDNYCFACSEVVSSNTSFYLDKFESLFLLRVLLEIPPESELPFNTIQVCIPCGSAIKQCKLIYTEISAHIQKFWELQTDILTKILKHADRHQQKPNQYNNWVYWCKQSVKTRNIETFKYPFVVHDITKIFNSFQEPHQFTDNFALATNVLIETPVEIPDESIGYSAHQESLDIPSFGDPLHIENEYDDKNDISDQFESSEEDASNPPQPQFYWNAVTRQFHCAVPSCTVANTIKTFVERHFHREHLRASATSKISYTCNWPSCGKTFKKKINHQSHIHKHRGTPSLKCDKCGKMFYYPRGLRFHQSRNICQPVYEQTSTSNGHSRFPISTNTIGDFDNTVVPNHWTPSLHSLNGSSISIDARETFVAENAKIILKTQPQFVDENDDDIASNNSDQSYELSENDDCLDDNSETSIENPSAMEHATPSTTNKTDGYICNWSGCGTWLSDKTTYTWHMDRHTGTPKQKCEQCDHLFYSGPDLIKHKRQHHKIKYCLDSITGRYECPEETCSKTYKNLRMMKDHYKEDHLKIKKKGGFVCEYGECNGRIFSSRRNWQAHIDKHKRTPQFKCVTCNQMFYWERHLLLHQKRKQHENQEDNTIRNVDLVVSNDIEYAPSTLGNFTAEETSEGNLIEKMTEVCQEDFTNFGNNAIPSHGLGEFGGSSCQILNLDSSSPAPFDTNNLNQSHSFHEIKPPSLAIEVDETFMAENDKIVLKTEPQFVDENDDDNESNGSGESYESSEDDDCSDDDGSENSNYYQPTEELATSTNSNDSDNCLDTYPCSWPGCEERLGDKTSLTCHMDRHRGTPKQKCEHCSDLFYSGTDLLNHLKMKHATQKKIEKSPRSTNAETVEIIKENKSFVCSWPGCGRGMSSKDNLLGHLDQHKGTPQWKCELCPHQSYWRPVFLKHMERKHGIHLRRREYKTPVTKTVKPKYILDTITGKYSCPEKSCSKTLKNLRVMKDHYKQNHVKAKEGFVCEYDECSGKTFTGRKYWQAHMETHKGTPQYKCDTCNQSFYWKRHLLRHQKRKQHLSQDDNSKVMRLEEHNLEDEGPFISNDIKYATSSLGNFTTEENSEEQSIEHITEVGQVEPEIRQNPLTGRFHCLDTFCSKSYVSKAYATEHYEVKHLKIRGVTRSYPCDWPGCGKIICDKPTWKGHMDKHKGTPGFKCEECEDKFYWKKSFVKHKQCFHGAKGWRNK